MTYFNETLAYLKPTSPDPAVSRWLAWYHIYPDYIYDYRCGSTASSGTRRRHQRQGDMNLFFVELREMNASARKKAPVFRRSFFQVRSDRFLPVEQPPDGGAERDPREQVPGWRAASRTCGGGRSAGDHEDRREQTALLFAVQDDGRRRGAADGNACSAPIGIGVLGVDHPNSR